MAGDILISKGSGSELRYYLGGRSLTLLVVYLENCMAESPVLESDQEFKEFLNEAHYGGVFFLNRCSDEKVAEVARMLDRALDPEHPFWRNEFMSRTTNPENPQIEERYADPQMVEWRNKNRQMYREISDLIRERLARHQEDEHRK